MRPITLIKTGRKLCNKIITKRLTRILKINNILKGDNYAALEGESTLIKILNNMLQEAFERKKEIWVLLLDY